MSTAANEMPTTTPNAYRPIMTTGCSARGKNAPTSRAYMGSFALQLMNGTSMVVILRSRSLDNVRVAMIDGTEQPNPMSSGTMERPDRPILRMGRSMTNATRAM